MTPGSAPSSATTKVWERFFARYIDVSLMGTVSFLLAGITMAELDFLLYELKISGMDIVFALSYILLSYVLMVLYLSLIEAVLHKVAGNTLGKALFGLKLQSLNQTPLTLKGCFWRSLKLNLLCVSIPVVNIAGGLWQLMRIGQGKPASYDVVHGNQVISVPRNTTQKLVAGVVVLLFVALTMFRVFTQS